MKKKGIPECILFVTHRVTKYPLMIEAIIKYSKDQPEETATLKKALDCVKDILVNINAQVAEKEKRQRLLEIYHKIDAKSSTMYKDHKFKKSDLLTDGRKLMFEGQAILSQQRGKQLIVVVVVMSDLIFFLQESNQKYYFVSPDNKAGAIPLGKLLVREKAGQDTRSIYLISGNQNEMFEFECSHPKDKRIWLESIREAVEKCPDDELGIGIRRLIEANSERIHELLLGMQHHDKELARMCEDKMKLITELVAALGGDVSALPSPDYRVLLEESNLDHESAKELQINSLQEALRLVGSASGWGTNLARSVSSVGEHQSEAYVSPSLPKRAETFGGFDNPNKDNPVHLSKQSGTKKKKDSKISLLSTDTSSTGDATDCLKNRRPSGSSLTVRSSQDNLSITSAQSGESSGQQQTLAAHLVQCLNTALVLSHHHLTQYEIYRAKLATGTSIDGRFSHSQKLEELRNIQEQISHERAQWTREREHQEKWITDKREELKRLQENLRSQQEDINQQREDLYRKLEALNNQGIVLNPCLTVLTSSHLNANETTSPSCDVIAPLQSPHTSPTTVAPRTIRTDSKLRNSTASLSGVKRDSNSSLPTHLISAANQQKGAVVAVKQQLPMKLAKLGAVGSSSSSSTSSMSSSLSSSLGGSMSPSQDKELPSKGYSTISYVTSHVSPSSVQQMLPLKLSEGSTGESKTGVSRLIGGYQRLASPPHAPSNTEGQGGLGANNTNSSSSHLHQRTGSSPASLQNGAALPLSSVSGYVPSVINSSVAVAVAGGRATRTHTYPKLAARPNPPQANAPSDSSSKENSPGHTGQPGQRIKDPDTDQEIIFF
ncbi:Rho guanine nucleotide exchange factor 18 [Armadillidium nasatum]|uniref:Rho guanine nucleotide exchange factor 18 n=1 Tax=Armadillidium nasatum TaxID=96803 RepID=A0A5N5T3J0_9CRUS|nr:Rho guanine nucleotide exchange factor 18 [Armadillidium nasatum]